MIDNNNQNNQIGNQNNQVEEQINVDKIDQKVNQIEQDSNKKEKEKGKGTFYGIIAFAVFIIMAVGATFAYFTASTSSSSGSVRTGSASLQLEYISYTSAWLSDKLIPVDTNIAEYSVEQRPNSEGDKLCMDDYGNQICSAYVFQVRNNELLRFERDPAGEIGLAGPFFYIHLRPCADKSIDQAFPPALVLESGRKIHGFASLGPSDSALHQKERNRYERLRGAQICLF